MALPFEKSDRLARWALELLEYDYEIVHRKGALHHVSDALSCAFERDTGDDESASALLVAAADIEVPDGIGDLWYRERFREVSEKPKLIGRWSMVSFII